MRQSPAESTPSSLGAPYSTPCGSLIEPLLCSGYPSRDCSLRASLYSLLESQRAARRSRASAQVPFGVHPVVRFAMNPRVTAMKRHCLREIVKFKYSSKRKEVCALEPRETEDEDHEDSEESFHCFRFLDPGPRHPISTVRSDSSDGHSPSGEILFEIRRSCLQAELFTPGIQLELIATGARCQAGVLLQDGRELSSCPRPCRRR